MLFRVVSLHYRNRQAVSWCELKTQVHMFLIQQKTPEPYRFKHVRSLLYAGTVSSVDEAVGLLEDLQTSQNLDWTASVEMKSEYAIFRLGTQLGIGWDIFHTRGLSFKGMHLKKVPDALFKLIHLKYLNLTDTGLRYLPRTIAKLQRLEQLEIADNYITKLPDTFKYLKSLVQFNCEGNPIRFSRSDLPNADFLHVIS